MIWQRGLLLEGSGDGLAVKRAADAPGGCECANAAGVEHLFTRLALREEHLIECDFLILDV